MERSQEFSEVESSSAEVQRAQAREGFSGRKLFCPKAVNSFAACPRYRYVRRARLRACVEGVESAGEANITEMEPLPAPVPLWRHPEMRVGDKALNAILGCMGWPFPANAPTPVQLAAFRARIDAISAAGFAQETAKKGWKETALRVPRADGGGTIEVLVLTRFENLAFGAKAPLIVHFHGGAFTAGTPRDANTAPLWNKLWDECGVQPCVASVAYRVAPEHPAPAAFDDAMAAVKFLLRSDELGLRFLYEPARVHLSGSSAGAAIALAVGAALCRSGDASAVGSLFLDCPMLDPRCDTPSYARNASAARLAPTKWTRWAWPAYLGDGRTAEEALADPRVCPHAAPGALAGVGGVRTVVATALADTLHDEGAAAAAALAAAGAAVHHVEIRGSHCGWLFDKGAAQRAVAALAENLSAEF